MSQLDFTNQVYDYLRTLGEPGDEVISRIKPWLKATYGLDEREAVHARKIAMGRLFARGLIHRVNARGPYVRILG
ncbi:hypothetical protein [Kribbella shirazensis]|uniref:Dam-replacing protein HTH domain-containing protein n=1 Tax=Kribbella shirazensis TaxID=1105143 RepID=A0A7X5ZZ17_9ACTN|nr:hypothetical protein [Kribbella shirazensis]NIK54649.1 hypothetical protein [Kribbella shirazensis]